MKITLQKVFLILCFFSHVFSTQVVIQDFLKKKKTNNGIIQLDSKSMNSVITKQRNYTMVIMFTATEEQYNCNLCKKLEPIFKLVAKSQYKTYPKSEELFFGILEFSDGPEVFEKLQLTAVPIIMLYPATIGPNGSRGNKPYILNIKNGDISSNWLAQVISQETKQSIRIIHFINYGKASILIFNSGYMFTRIRNISFNGYNNDIPIYILEIFNSQYGIESLIISTTCENSLLSLSLFLIIK
ncbi:hypothetical protein PMAC_003026 [Pneumocystis sp. 'macacae']|nr:hypothetical protein PMAC_003026 [Pneumocystis sp. 'macacae']